jgi:hypothetical protein
MRENRWSYIEEALEAGYNVEIDVWGHNGRLFLGHSEAGELLPLIYLQIRELWIHCKNIEAVDILSEYDVNYFWHDSDDMTLTSHGYKWVYPGKRIPQVASIAVLPERFPDWNIKDAVGICSDFVERYKNEK